MAITIIENKTSEDMEVYEKALGRPPHFRFDMTPKQVRKNNQLWQWWFGLVEQLCQLNPCPYCYAEPGQPCPKRKAEGSHYGRRQLAGFRSYDGTNLMVRDGRAFRWEKVYDPPPIVVKGNEITIESKPGDPVLVIKRGDEVLTTLRVSS